MNQLNRVYRFRGKPRFTVAVRREPMETGGGRRSQIRYLPVGSSRDQARDAPTVAPTVAPIISFNPNISIIVESEIKNGDLELKLKDYVDGESGRLRHHAGKFRSLPRGD